ncbi:MAG: hypothetical protein IT492_24015 [Gammaproteobacteria bacterium]|nr:hypothetical protein [Gammaproteobacteria bacterium]
MLKAIERVYTRKRISAEDAVVRGLSNRVVEHNQLLTEARALAAELSTQPRGALRESKPSVNLYVRRNIETVPSEIIERRFARTQGPEHGAAVAGHDRQAEAEPAEA